MAGPINAVAISARATTIRNSGKGKPKIFFIFKPLSDLFLNPYMEYRTSTYGDGKDQAEKNKCHDPWKTVIVAIFHPPLPPKRMIIAIARIATIVIGVTLSSKSFSNLSKHFLMNSICFSSFNFFISAYAEYFF